MTQAGDKKRSGRYASWKTCRHRSPANCLLYRIVVHTVSISELTGKGGAHQRPKQFGVQVKIVDTKEKSQVQVIARAAAILRALENENAGLSLGQIAQRVDLARSTVQRIIAALEVEKLVIAASPNGKMRLGPTILRLAASVRTNFASLARPFLVALSKELGETVDLSTIKKDQVVFIDQVTGPHRLQTVSVVG